MKDTRGIWIVDPINSLPADSSKNQIFWNLECKILIVQNLWHIFISLVKGSTIQIARALNKSFCSDTLHQPKNHYPHFDTITKSKMKVKKKTKLLHFPEIQFFFKKILCRAEIILLNLLLSTWVAIIDTFFSVGY